MLGEQCEKSLATTSQTESEPAEQAGKTQVAIADVRKARAHRRRMLLATGPPTHGGTLGAIQKFNLDRLTVTGQVEWVPTGCREAPCLAASIILQRPQPGHVACLRMIQVWLSVCHMPKKGLELFSQTDNSARSIACDAGSEPSPTSPSRSYSFRHVVAELSGPRMLMLTCWFMDVRPLPVLLLDEAEKLTKVFCRFSPCGVLHVPGSHCQGGLRRLKVCNCLHLYGNAEPHSLQDFGVFGLSYMLPQQPDCQPLLVGSTMQGESTAVHATCQGISCSLRT